MTISDKYKMTAAEKRLFEVLINPTYVGKSVTEQCNLAKVSRNKYYDAMKNKQFVKLINDTTMDLIKGKASDVLNAAYKFALTEKGHQDRKMILTIAEVYTEKTETKVTADVTVETENPLKGLTFEQLKELAATRHGYDANE